MPAIPKNYKRLEASERKAARGARMVGSVDPKEVLELRKGVSQEWRFYEAEFVKTRCVNSLCFIFCSFLPTSDNNSPVWLWCLIIAAAFTPQ
jgi:hypothetical protein